MTAKISQNVVPRRRTSATNVAFNTINGTWQLRARATSRSFTRPSRGARIASALPWQRGSITHSTLTISVALMALVTMAALGLFYLQQVFDTASQGTDVQALEQQISELREQQRQLELEGANLRSIQAVEERIKELNLVEADEVAYLPATPDRVALEL